MTLKRVWIVAAVVWCLAGMCATPVWAEDTDVSRATLAGLQGVHVIVEEMQDNVRKYAKRFGLTQAQVQKDVEERLRRGGIRTVTGDEWLAVPGRPILYVNINTHETEKYWYAYDVKVELRQVVTLVSDPQVKTMAVTWSLNMTGQANIGTLDVIRQDTNILVERFVEAWKKAGRDQK